MAVRESAEVSKVLDSVSERLLSTAARIVLAMGSRNREVKRVVVTVQSASCVAEVASACDTGTAEKPSLHVRICPLTPIAHLLNTTCEACSAGCTGPHGPHGSQRATVHVHSELRLLWGCAAV